MRRITALLIAVGLLVFGFGGGIFAGYQIFDEETFVAEKISKKKGSGVVAVVSNDMGVETKDGIVNYADAFISKLDSSTYVHTPSATEAEMGLESGDYDAIVTFPATLSEQIIRNDYEDPYRIQIRYYLSRELDDKSTLEAHDKVIDLYTEFNDNLSYSYIKAVFDQVSLAQFSADKVFSNDKNSIALARKLAADNYMKGLEPRTIEEKTPKDSTVDPGKYPYLNPGSSNGKNFAAEANSLYNSIFNSACDKVYDDYSASLQTYKDSITKDKQDMDDAMQDVSNDASGILTQIGKIKSISDTIATMADDGGAYNDLVNYRAGLVGEKQKLDNFYTALVNWKSDTGQEPDPDDYKITIGDPVPVDKLDDVTVYQNNIENLFARIYDPNNDQAYLSIVSSKADSIVSGANTLCNDVKSQGGNVKTEAENTIKNTSSGDGKTLSDCESEFVSDVSKFVSASDQAQRESNASLGEAYKYYSESMANLQKDTDETYAKEAKSLDDALRIFLNTAEANSNDNKKKLSVITGMFKDSKNNNGNINNEVMQFLIQPVEIIEEQ